MLERKRKDDFEPYWQHEKDWLRIVEFLPTDSPEARLFAADIIGHLVVGMQISRAHARWHSWGILPERRSTSQCPCSFSSRTLPRNMRYTKTK
jgi:hypothetical protein